MSSLVLLKKIISECGAVLVFVSTILALAFSFNCKTHTQKKVFSSCVKCCDYPQPACFFVTYILNIVLFQQDMANSITKLGQNGCYPRKLACCYETFRPLSIINSNVL